MREIIGVESWISVFGVNDFIKRDALFFDKIAIPHLNTFLQSFERAENEDTELLAQIKKRFSIDDCLREVHWLIDNGFLFETTHQFDNHLLNANTDFQVNSLKLINLIASIQEIAENGGADAFRGFVEQVRQPNSQIIFDAKLREVFNEVGQIIETTNRLFAIQLRELENLEAYPILLDEIKVNDKSEANKTDVIQITLNALPMPDENTSWEQIRDFRNNPDSKQKFLDLRQWMNDITRAKLSPVEIEQKLEYLISQYQRETNLHKLKTNSGILEAIIISSAEIAEDLTKFRFSKIAKLLFSIKHKKIELLENEINAKGSEVAYIINAQESFYKPER